MLTVEEAQQRVLDEVRALEDEVVALIDAQGRVLREDVAAPIDLPQGDNSAMDGYALRAEDTWGKGTPARPDRRGRLSSTLRVIEDIAAGHAPKLRVERGTASRIMTGALIPEGADAVAQVEITDGGREVVQIHQAVAGGTNVRRRGDDMRAGEIILRVGTPIRAAEIGVLASVGKTSVRVGQRPRIAILATGDEIVEIDRTPAFGQVANSNSYALAALAREAGALPQIRGIVRDDRDVTIAAIESALDCDFVVSSGGVSVGAYDFVKDALDTLGAETKFWKVAMKPGKPVVLSRVRERLFFGLPGNPVSSMVAFILFVAPSIRKAMGQTANLFAPAVRMRAAASLRSKGDRRSYLRVRVVAHGGELVAHPMPSQGSHVSTSMLGANGLAVLEAGTLNVNENGAVNVCLFGVPFAS
jgi:molybdopterin molybdotransferase